MKCGTKWGGKASPKPFLKILNLSLDQQAEVSYSLVFIVCLSRGLPRCWPLAFTSYEANLKNKEKSGSSVTLPHFLHDF